jgi:hypothetical protein
MPALLRPLQADVRPLVTRCRAAPLPRPGERPPQQRPCFLEEVLLTGVVNRPAAGRAGPSGRSAQAAGLERSS